MVTHFARQLLQQSIKEKLWNTVDKFQESQFFEVTEIASDCIELAYYIHKTGLSKDNLFLPAPITWLEFRPYPDDENPRLRDFRTAYWLTETDTYFDVIWMNSHDKSGEYKIKKEEYSALNENDYRKKFLSEVENENYHKNLIDQRQILFLLTMINTPRLVGRRQHMPDRKLEKSLLRSRPNIGKFPLQAWTEITLHVGEPTKDVSGKPSKEAHLTGMKPLHFCRQHWRVRLGRLERVKAHWRGDPSLGIKRSRYKVTP